MSPAEAEKILEGNRQGPVTEQSVPEFRYLESIDQSPAPKEEGEPLAALPGQTGAAATAGMVRVAVLHGQGQEQAAIGLATVIDRYQNEKLSKSVGRPVKVAYVSRFNGAGKPTNLVRYRVGMLKAALQLAAVLPGDQLVEPMTPEEGGQTTVEVVIYLGSTVR